MYNSIGGMVNEIVSVMDGEIYGIPVDYLNMNC